MEVLLILVIGIGVGNVIDGQILVMYDVFGIIGGYILKFVKNFFVEVGDMCVVVWQYMVEVEFGVYLGEEYSFY